MAKKRYLASNPDAHVTDFTEDEIAAAVNANDPTVNRFFGAKIKDHPYAPAAMSRGEAATQQAIIASWPRFAISGSYDEPPDGKAWLWLVPQKNAGKVLLANDQKRGSCVGQGYEKALGYLQSIDTWVRGEREQVRVPYFWLWNYGISRWIIKPSGGQGEGSFGAAIAEAGKYGTFAQDDPDLSDLPPYDEQNGMGRTWHAKAEMDWSHINPTASKWAKYLAQAKGRTVKTTAILRSSAEVAAAVINGYPVTCASTWGGKMQCPVKGTGANAHLRNSRADTWPHQMCIIGWWRHPTDGELFYVQNSWSIRAHGTCPTGAPAGGFWVSKADVDWMIRDNGELIAYSSYESGYPANLIDWRDAYRW